MSLMQQYQQALASGVIRPDVEQKRVLLQLENLLVVLQTIKDKPAKKKSLGLKQWLSSAFKPKAPQTTAQQGIYLWGGVGRGKTWLMDQFFQAVPQHHSKRRWHFNQLMLLVHEELLHYSLPTVAEHLAKQYRLICLDEFFIKDMGDAMLMYGLLNGLLEQGCVLVITSNRHPDDLYKGGVARKKFQPAVDLLKQHLQIISLGGDTDYRASSPHKQGISHLIHTEGRADQKLAQYFYQFANGQVKDNPELSVYSRPIKVRKLAEDVAWFDFAELCDGPRASKDYIYLAERFRFIFLSDVPVMCDDLGASARRFLNLIDELYDRRIGFVMSAAVGLDQLYNGKILQFEFQRTVSRLREMQSGVYLEALLGKHKVDHGELEAISVAA